MNDSHCDRIHSSLTAVHYFDNGYVEKQPVAKNKNRVLDWSKLKAFAGQKINVTEKLEFVFGKGRKHGEKRRKCWLPAFSPVPTKVSLYRVVKSRDCVVKNLRNSRKTWVGALATAIEVKYC